MKRIGYAVLVLGMVASAQSCEDSATRPDPPDPPPQLKLEIFEETADPTPRTLPDNDVYDIKVGPSGNLWIATDQGVARIDANRASNAVYYDDFNGIPNRKTRSLLVFRSNVYVGTWGGGVAIFNGTDWDPLPIRTGSANNGVIDGQITCMAPDVVNPMFMWIGTVAGMTRYEDNTSKPMNNRFTQFSNRLDDRPNNLLPQWRDITSMFVRQDPVRGKELWVSRRTDGIIVVRFPGETRYRPGNSAIPSALCNGVVYDAVSDKFWSVFSDKGIASIDIPNSLWRNYTREDGLENDLGSSIAVRSNGDMWIGTQGGVSLRKADGTIVNFVKGSGLPDARVRKVYVHAATGNVYLGFVEGGAALIQDIDSY